MRDDAWAEYRDGAFLERIELEYLTPELERFWPRGGPQWDGLARTADGKVLLIEAKAHVPELASSCVASPASRTQIERALQAARSHFGAHPASDWLTGYYQYANRLAHLYFLRSHGVDAHLVFLYFVSDHEMGGPASIREWEGALEGVYRHLGLNPQQSVAGFHSVYIDVSQLASTAPPAQPRAAGDKGTAIFSTSGVLLGLGATLWFRCCPLRLSLRMLGLTQNPVRADSTSDADRYDCRGRH